MSGYKNFAVIGAGAVGEAVIKALVEVHANVIVLSRPESTSKNIPDGLKRIRVDFADVDVVAAAFSENAIDVVVASVTTFAVAAQIPLADAAKKANVKLFVPSEFGFPSNGVTSGPIAEKDRIAKYLQAIGVPSLRLFTGGFFNYFPWVTQYKDGKIYIIGNGDKKVSWTDLGDTAGYLAHITTHLPPSKLENKIFRLESEYISLREIAALYGDKAEVVQVEKIVDDPLADELQRLLEVVGASTGFDPASGKILEGENAAGSGNALWENHRWKSFKEGLGL